MTITTPNMSLVLPDVNSTPGPQWAVLLNAAYTLIDSHNHSTGQGVQITPAGLNISSDLSFVQNNAINLRSARLYNNSTISLGVNDKTCLYSLNNELYYVDGAGNNVQVTSGGTLNLTGGITNLTINDSSFFLQYFGDNTRKFRFNASAIPASTTRILSIPDSGANDTIVTQTATQTLTNKTLTGNTAANLISSAGQLTLNTTGTITLPNATDTVAVLAASQTITNKILTGNTAANIKPDGVQVFTFPAVTDTAVGLTSAQTLTNKTLTAPIVSNYGDFTEITTPPAPSSGVVRVYSKSGDALYYQTSAGTEKIISTGASVSYSRSDVATAATITALTSASSLVRLTGSTATSLQGIGAGTAGLQMLVYNVSTALVSITNQNASATAANRIITPSGLTVYLQPQWTAEFVYDDSQSRWVLTQTSSVTEWTAYTPTFTGLGTTSSASAFYKIIGDTLYVSGSVTSGTTAATLFSVSLPTGFTINSSKLSIANTTTGGGNILGNTGEEGNGTQSASYIVSATATSTSVVYCGTYFSDTLKSITTPQLANNNFGSSKNITYKFEVPI